MVMVKCERCGKETYHHKRQAAINDKNFCSRKCYGLYKRESGFKYVGATSPELRRLKQLARMQAEMKK